MPSITVRPRWLLYLMIFFIGWSRVFAASVEMPMDTQKFHISTEQKTVTDSHSHMKCHQAMTHAEPAASVKSVDCHQQQATQQSGHMPCADCSSSHCQSLNSSLPHYLPMSGPFLDAPQESRTYRQDPAQHLTGYWQEILRPPRA